MKSIPFLIIYNKKIVVFLEKVSIFMIFRTVNMRGTESMGISAADGL